MPAWGWLLVGCFTGACVVYVFLSAFRDATRRLDFMLAPLTEDEPLDGWVDTHPFVEGDDR